mmetsp:Transcript_136818/g.193507  ORF Transcript_136818/g.193507 Transcript_136818/m.193507 type:complete len:216 (-) Transcript_136818:52-699(-)
MLRGAGKKTFLRAMATQATKAIVVDPFCLRQFDKTSGKGPFLDTTVEKFEEHVNAALAADPDNSLKPGYAPFCKHIFVDNFCNATMTVSEITPANEGLMRSGYVTRQEGELAVLSRWFPADAMGSPKVAPYLDVILYSREQIRKENEAMGKKSESDAPWGVVSVKAQDVQYELPMQPITMMRNALGKAEGGSGVPLDTDKYRESVEYWSKHAPIQ